MIIAIVAAASVVGYLLGRLQPWSALDVWAENEVRFYGPWTRGNKVQQATVLVARCLTHPRHSWRSLWKGH
ncbi:hypothetical protein ABZ769_35530 [Streptomyces olivoreticuli]